MKKFIMLMLLMLATLAHASADDDPQPYAVFDNGTLTFYCDNQKATHSGAMDLNEDYTAPEWYQYASEITTVEFDPMFKNASPTSCYRWFTEFTNLTEIKGIQYLNTSEVSDMSGMFEGCKALKSLDLSSFNTSEVTDMSYMFSDCYALESLDLSSFNTSKVSMSSMFSYSSAIKTILVGSGWNVNEVTSSDDMFSGCEKLIGGEGFGYNDNNDNDRTNANTGDHGYLTSLGQCTPYAVLEDNPDGETKTLVFRFGYKPDNAMSLNKDYVAPDWNNNASKITTVEFDPLFQYASPTTCSYWFYQCTNLTEIKGIQYLNTSEVTNMSHMFKFCYALQSLDLSSFNTERVTNMNYMFSGCKALKSLDLSSFNTSGVEEMGNMFYDCNALKSLDLSSFNTEKVMVLIAMFSGCSALKTILVGSSWNVANVEYSDFMFEGCEKLTGGNGTTYKDGNPKDKTYAVIDGKDGNPGYLTSLDQVKPYAVFDSQTSTLTFYDDKQLRDGAMPLNEGTNDPAWKNGASSITTVVFDPSFSHAQPTSCYKWFNNCSNLTEIKGIEYLNTSEVTVMNKMFQFCSSLESLDLSSFNTGEVTSILYMFYGCQALESLNLSSFNTGKVEDMEGMFEHCESLESLNLSSFNTSKVTNMSAMFSHCIALKTILVGSGWNVANVEYSAFMFSSCENLTGGSGTTYTDDKPIDKTFAVIDGKDGKDGYLTLNALTLTNENGSTTAVLNGDFADGINAVLIINKEIKVDALTFNRKFTNGVTATVMFPFGFKTSDDIKGTFHTITKVGPDKNGVWTAELSAPITDIKANTPYIFYPSDDITSITFNNITLVPTDGTLTNGDANGWQLHGVYSKKIWTEDSNNEYGFAAVKVEEDNIEAGEFVLAGKDAWADPMRCYLTYAGSGKPFTAKAATVLPDRIRVVFPSDNDDEITTDPAEVITPVSSVSETEDVKVWSFGGTVYIQAQPDMDYTIIDLSGRTIKKGVTHSTREEVALSRHAGIVIVNINGKSVKVNL